MTDQTDIDALIKRLREGVSYGTAPYEAAAALETLSARCGELEEQLSFLRSVDLRQLLDKAEDNITSLESRLAAYEAAAEKVKTSASAISIDRIAGDVFAYSAILACKEGW